MGSGEQCCIIQKLKIDFRDLTHEKKLNTRQKVNHDLINLTEM